MASASPTSHMTRTAVAGPAHSPVWQGHTPFQATGGLHSISAGLILLLTWSAPIRRSSSFRIALFCSASATRRQRDRSPIPRSVVRILVWPQHLRRLASVYSPASSLQTVLPQLGTWPASKISVHLAVRA